MRFGTSNTSNAVTEWMRISSSGNLGIGTTAPSTTLDVSGNISIRGAGSNGYITLIQGGANNTGFIEWRNPDTSRMTYMGYGNSTTFDINVEQGRNLFMYTNAVVRMTISSAGNIGIGTTAPSFTLDVAGTARVTTGITTGGLEITGSGVVDTPNLTVTTAASISSLSISGATRVVNIGHTADTSNYAMEIYAPVSNGLLETSIRFHQEGRYWQQIRAYNAGFKFTQGDSSSLVNIEAGGIIGSGLTTASAQITNANVTTSTIGTLRTTNEITTNISSATLNLSSGLTTASAQITNATVTTNLLAIGNSNTIASIFTTGGNVGIGTVAPGTLSESNINLDVQGSTAFDGSTILRLYNNAAQYGRTQIRLVGRYEALNDSWSTAPRNAIMFQQQTAQAGTISTKYILQNFGEHLGILNGSATPLMTWTSIGNVGIGTTGPSFTLDIAGTARISNSITTGGLNTSNLIASNITVSNLIASTFSPSNLNTTNVTCTSLLATNITSAGVIRFGNNATSGISFGNNFSRLYDDGHLRMYTDDNMYFYTSNTTASRMYINPNGNIGIGTESLSSIAKLHVHGQDSSLSSGSHMTFTTSTDSFPTMQIFNYSHDTAALLFDAYYDSSGFLRLSHTSGFAIYKSNNALTIGGAVGSAGASVTTENAITINTGGSLGMGTSTPGEKLDIRGNLRVGNSTSANYISFHGTNGDSPANWNHTYIGERIYSAGSELSELLLFKGNDTVPSAGPDRIRLLAAEHRFDTYSSSLSGSFDTIGASGTTRMIIDNNGNVGIGNASPSFNLDITGTARITAALTTGNLYANGLLKSMGELIVGTTGSFSLMPRIQMYSHTDSTNPILQLGAYDSSAAGIGLGCYLLNASPGTMTMSSSNTSWFLGKTGAGFFIERCNGTTGSQATSTTAFTISNNGNASFTGSLSKASGTFDIAHPIVQNKRLVHSFIEGPRCDLIYRGQVQLNNGQATVNLDVDCVAESDCAMSTGTFESLCANPQHFLQNRDSFDRVKGSINGGILTIECENTNSTDTIYWSVIAERKDQHIKTWDKTNANGYLVTEYNNSQ
jgi:hypothetical protein